MRNELFIIISKSKMRINSSYDNLIQILFNLKNHVKKEQKLNYLINMEHDAI